MNEMSSLIDQEAIAASGFDEYQAKELLWAQPIQMRGPPLAKIFIIVWLSLVVLMFLVTFLIPESAGENTSAARLFLVGFMIFGGYMFSQMRGQSGLYLVTNGKQVWLGGDGETEELPDAYINKIRVTQKHDQYTLSLIPKTFDDVRFGPLGVKATLLPPLRVIVRNENYKELALALSNSLNIPIHFHNRGTKKIIKPPTPPQGSPKTTPSP